MNNKTIAFIGAGNMTTAIVSGLVENGYSNTSIVASNPSMPKLNVLAEKFDIKVTQNNEEACKQADVIVLAVKPQLMEEVCGQLSSSVDLNGKLIVSIAAGISAKRLSEMLSQYNNIIRVMPNTPSSLGKGMAGLFAQKQVSPDDCQFAEYIMSMVGKTTWVDKEDDIDLVIATAGSSPAYFFLFLEAMQDEAIRQGLDKQKSRLLVQQAMLGAAEMVCHNPNLELSELRAQVTSKGGTTAKAIESFQADDLEQLVSRAMQAAVARAKEMSKQF